MIPIILILVFLLWIVLVAYMWTNRYVKVAPNQALIISGRQRKLSDGRTVGFRIVKGGGTFVLPVVETMDTLSLEVLTLDIPSCAVRTSEGAHVEVGCAAQVKIKGDENAITTAAEHFLTKSETEFKNSIRPVLEKHLRAILSNSTVDEISQFFDACAVRIQTAAATDLGNMGLNIISFSIRTVRT